MNRILMLIMALATGISPAEATTSPAAAATAQSDVLSKVSSVYKGYETIRAEFSFVYFQNEQDLIGRSETGTLLLDKTTGKYRISTDAQELISDGSAQWAVLKEAEEVQVTDVGTQDGSITPLNVFSFFHKGYAVQQLADEKSGNSNLYVIELTPEDRRKTYSKIKLRINKTNHHIADVTVFDKNKSRYRYTILDLKANEPIAAQRFVFDPAEYPGMEIVDLR